MRICLVGGIFGKPDAYRRTVTHTPETVLAAGLRERGHFVLEQPHAARLMLDGVDLVHVHHLGSGAVAAASADVSAPVVFTPHYLRHREWPRRIASRYVAGRSDAVVALSETEAVWQREAWRLPAERQCVIANGIDAHAFPFIPPPSPPPPGKRWRVLFVGQLARFKRVSDLLKALALIKDRLSVELGLVYQVDTELEALRSEAEQLGLAHVAFLGMLTPTELARFYGESHLLVLPSSGEALSSVISEALYVGRPVVATDVGAAGEQVADFGELVPVADPEALARAILRTLSDYERYAAASRAASQRAVSRYSITAMIDAHERMYEQVITLGRKRRSRAQRVLDRLAEVPLRLRAR